MKKSDRNRTVPHPSSGSTSPAICKACDKEGNRKYNCPPDHKCLHGKKAMSSQLSREYIYSEQCLKHNRNNKQNPSS